MAWWDDFIRTITGGGQKEEPRRPAPSGRSREGGGSFAPRETVRPTSNPNSFTPRSMANANVTFEGATQPQSNAWAQPTGAARVRPGYQQGNPAREDPFAYAQRAGGIAGSAFLGQGGDDSQFKQDILATGQKNDKGTQKVLEESNILNPEPSKPENVQVRQLTQEEWNALNGEQQKAIVGNFALYNATKLDNEKDSREEGAADYKSSVAELFGQDKGSQRYAPNTLAVMRDLGIKGNGTDLDQILSGGALVTENEIMGQSNRADRQQTQSSLQSASAFSNPDLASALQQGQSLIDALNSTPTLGQDTLALSGVQRRTAGSQIDPVKQEELRTVLSDMSNRQFWNQIQTDSASNEALKNNLAQATAGLDPNLVTEFFRETYQGFGGDDQYMSYDEFANNWLNREG